MPVKIPELLTKRIYKKEEETEIMKPSREAREAATQSIRQLPKWNGRHSKSPVRKSFSCARAKPQELYNNMRHKTAVTTDSSAQVLIIYFQCCRPNTFYYIPLSFFQTAFFFPFFFKEKVKDTFNSCRENLFIPKI